MSVIIEGISLVLGPSLTGKLLTLSRSHMRPVVRDFRKSGRDAGT